MKTTMSKSKAGPASVGRFWERQGIAKYIARVYSSSGQLCGFSPYSLSNPGEVGIVFMLQSSLQTAAELFVPLLELF